MAIGLYAQSFGLAYANATVYIREVGTSLPATVMASSTGGVVSYNGMANLDAGGDLAVYIDTAKNWVVTLESPALSPSTTVTAGGFTAVPAASFNRPADTTAYAVGDLVANTTTAGSVVPLSLTIARTLGGSGIIRRVRIRKTGTSLTNASFRVHFFSSWPTVANGDNGVFSSSGSASYFGSADVSMTQTFTDGAFGSTDSGFSDIQFNLTSSQLIYALVEARGAYTPANGELFTVSVEVIQD